MRKKNTPQNTNHKKKQSRPKKSISDPSIAQLEHALSLQPSIDVVQLHELGYRPGKRFFGLHGRTIVVEVEENDTGRSAGFSIISTPQHRLYILDVPFEEYASKPEYESIILAAE